MLLLDAGTGRPRGEFTSQPEPVQALRFSRDGRILTAIDEGSVLMQWETATGRLLRARPDLDPIMGQSFADSHRTAALADDGIRLAASLALADRVGLVDLRGPIANPGRLVYRSRNRLSLSCIAFVPAARQLACGEPDGRVSLWNPITGATERTFVAHNTDITCLQYAPDGKTLFTGSRDGIVKQWDPTTGRLQAGLKGHTAAISRLIFTPRGTGMASADRHGEVRIWDLMALHDERAVQAASGLVYALSYAPDGTRLALADGQSAKVLNASDSRELSQFRDKLSGVLAIAYAPDGRSLASGDLNSNVRLWDAMTGMERYALPGNPSLPLPEHMVGCLSYSPDGKMLAARFGAPAAILSDYDQQVLIYDPVHGGLLRRLTGFHNTIAAVIFAPSGDLLAVACHDHRVKLFTTTDWRPVMTLQQSSAVCALTFSHDGRSLVTGGRNGVTTRYAMPNGQIQEQYRGHTDTCNALAFSRDDRTLISAGLDRAVKMWDLASGRQTRTLIGRHNWVQSLALSPDGPTLVTAEAGGVLLFRQAVALGEADASDRRREGETAAAPPPAIEEPSPGFPPQPEFPTRRRIEDEARIRRWRARRLAEDAFSTGAWREALQRLAEYQNGNPAARNAYYWHLRSIADAQMARYGQAVADLRRSMTLGGSVLDVYNPLLDRAECALALLALGDSQGYRKICHEALSVAEALPTGAVAVPLVAIYTFGPCDPRDAERMLLLIQKRAALRSELMTEPGVKARLLYRAARYREAWHALLAAQQVEGDSYGLALFRAMTAARLGKAAEAARALSAARQFLLVPEQPISGWMDRVLVRLWRPEATQAVAHSAGHR